MILKKRHKLFFLFSAVFLLSLQMVLLLYPSFNPMYLSQLQPHEVSSQDTGMMEDVAVRELKKRHLNPKYAKTKVLVVVYSDDSLKSTEFRQSIRQTWGSILPEESSLVFFIGNNGRKMKENTALSQPQWDISKEQELWGDIVLLNITEGAISTSEKMVHTYQFLGSRKDLLFPQLVWIFKVDATEYVNVAVFRDIMNQLVESPEKYQRSMVGKVVSGKPVSKEGPWRDEGLALDVYPKFVASQAYFLNVDVVHWIRQNADLGWFKIFPNEDSLLGIWFAGLNIQLKQDHRFLFSAESNTPPKALYFDPRREPQQQQQQQQQHYQECSKEAVTLYRPDLATREALHASFLECGNPCLASCQHH